MQMQGFLDHLEVAGHVVHKKTWTRRFFRLNDAFHCLEFFTDASMQSRKGRIELQHAHVASADELGELLFSSRSASAKRQSHAGNTSSKMAIENSRRFVFRIAATGAAGGGSTPCSETTSATPLHYLCAEITPTDADGSSACSVDAAASRQYLDQWLRALRATALRASTPAVSAVAPVDLRELHATIARFMDDLHISLHVTQRREHDTTARGVYEISVQAWTLQKELLPLDDDDADSTHGSSSEWQLLEYACAWQIAKSSAQLRDFDAQLRHFFGEQLRDLALPSFAGVRAFLKHKHEHDSESERRVALYNEYWDTLLRLPAFSVFGSDGGAMLDTFLEISPHLVAFKKLEKQSGQNLKLRNKKVVPWRERERFEQLFAIHVEMERAKSEAKAKQQRLAAKQQQQARQQSRREEKEEAERQQRHSHSHSHSHSHRHRQSEKTAAAVVVEEAEEPLRPVETTTEEAVESVHERIARIGHKLLVEAFQTDHTPPPQQ